MKQDEPVALKRDCVAVQIPSGNAVTLPAGMVVRVRQSLGGSYTVITDDGFMVRIAAQDADALGIDAGAALRGRPELNQEQGNHGGLPLPSKEEIEKKVWDQLRTVFDPEIPVNVVDLGLIYLCQVNPLSEGGHRVDVKMTLTAPGCGMGNILQADAQAKIASLPGVKAAHVEMVIDPPWNPSMMSEAAKLQLGML